MTRDDPAGEGLLESLTETALYSIGAAFADAHPELVDDVLVQAIEIEQQGLRRWADRETVPLDTAFETLVTGLALRFYRALAG